MLDSVQLYFRYLDVSKPAFEQGTSINRKKPLVGPGLCVVGGGIIASLLLIALKLVVEHADEQSQTCQRCDLSQASALSPFLWEVLCRPRAVFHPFF